MKLAFLKLLGPESRNLFPKAQVRMLFSFVALGLLSLVHAGPFLIPTYTTTTNSVTW